MHWLPQVSTGSGSVPTAWPRILFFPGQEGHTEDQGYGCHGIGHSQQGPQVLAGPGTSAPRTPTGSLVLRRPVRRTLGLPGCNGTAGDHGARGDQLQVAVVVEKGGVFLAGTVVGAASGCCFSAGASFFEGLVKGAFPSSATSTLALVVALAPWCLVWGCWLISLWTPWWAGCMGQAGGCTRGAQESSTRKVLRLLEMLRWGENVFCTGEGNQLWESEGRLFWVELCLPKEMLKS